MKAPEVKKPWSGFQSAAPIRKLCHVRPSLVEVAWNVVMLWLFGSVRRSSQIAWNFPCSSTAIYGKN